MDDELFSSRSTYDSDESRDDDVQMFNEKEDDELTHAVEEGLITPPPTEVEKGTLHLQLISLFKLLTSKTRRFRRTMMIRASQKDSIKRTAGMIDWRSSSACALARPPNDANMKKSPVIPIS